MYDLIDVLCFVVLCVIQGYQLHGTLAMTKAKRFRVKHISTVEKLVPTYPTLCYAWFMKAPFSSKRDQAPVLL